MKQQIERDRRSNYLGEIASCDRAFAEQPENDGDGPRVMVAAGLREIASGDDAELRRQPLEQNGHEVGEQNDAEERIPEARSAGEVGRPVARIHVADGHEVSGAGEREKLAKEAPRSHWNRSIDLLKARCDART